MPNIDRFENVTVVIKANTYFDGGVVSHTVINADGTRKTIGLIRPGTYHFNTEAPEQMDIVSGQCLVKMTGDKDWKTYEGGSSFHVPGKSGFDIKVESGLTEYVCSFG